MILTIYLIGCGLAFIALAFMYIESKQWKTYKESHIKEVLYDLLIIFIGILLSYISFIGIVVVYIIDWYQRKTGL